MKIEGDWLTAPATRAVVAAIGDTALFVGGCVRNALLGVPISDIDLSTPLQPAEVTARAEAAGLRAIPTGIDHGTVTLLAGDRAFEVTTFRADIATDGRRAVVRFSTEIAEDAARRDFTMNALYARMDGSLVDPLGGLEDLQARRVRFILDPERRIREDALRILRFFRFTAWYGSEIEAEGLAACAVLADLIDGLARERIGAEMRKLLAASDPAPAVAAMAASGVLARCLPGAETAALAPLVAREQIAGVEPDWRTRLAAITPSMAVETLRLTNAEVRHLSSIAKALEAPYGPAALAASHGAEVAEAALLLRTALEPAPWLPLASEIVRGARAELPLTARDLVAAGLAEGPMLGAALSRARTAWLDSDLTLDKAALMREALDRSL